MRLFVGNDRGSAAAPCGKALPFRCSSLYEGEASPRLGGLASLSFGLPAGKAKPYRTVLRQSRKFVFLITGLFFGFSLTNLPSEVHSSPHSMKGLEMSVQERTRIRAPELMGDRGWLTTDKP